MSKLRSAGAAGTSLSKAACAAWLRKWEAARTFARTLDAEHPGTVAIGRPKLDSRVTESVAVHLLNDGLLLAALPDLIEARRGSGVGAPDLDLRVRTGRNLNGELKAVGPADWQRASAKDVECDVFLFMSLGPVLLGEREEMIIYCIRDPGRYLRAGLDWRSEAAFVRLCAGDVVRVEVSIAWLDPSLPAIFREGSR